MALEQDRGWVTATMFSVSNNMPDTGSAITILISIDKMNKNDKNLEGCGEV